MFFPLRERETTWLERMGVKKSGRVYRKEVNRGLKGHYHGNIVTYHPRKIFRSGAMKWEKELHMKKKQNDQKRDRERMQVEQSSAPNMGFLQALDNKEGMFKMQAATLGSLAAEENRLKGLSDAVGPAVVDFDSPVRCTEESLKDLWSTLLSNNSDNGKTAT